MCDYLPGEIIFEILCRVPVKTVGLCHCVLKSWRAMLSKPEFIKTHLQLNKINSLESLALSVCPDGVLEIYFAPLNNTDEAKVTMSLTKSSFVRYSATSRYRVYGSCDGLLLVLVPCYWRDLFVLNPVTKWIKKVRMSPNALYTHNNPLLWYGFGYDSVSDDYKIVITSHKSTLIDDWLTNAVNEMFVVVYSLKKGSWKKIDESLNDYVGICTAPGVFVGGCLHWLDYRITDYNLAIVAFDLASEKFGEVQLPHSMSDNLSRRSQVGVLGGCLCMNYEKKIHECIIVEFWLMKEYGVAESWTKFTVDCYGAVRCFLSYQEQLVMQKCTIDKCAIWNTKQRTLKEIVLDNAGSRRCIIEASFVESLVSPHYINDPEKK